ncbi:MAG TPA: cytochrome c3 family protein [Pyrinomonadaceae bacterium]|jgi:cytochrome c553
MKLFLVSVALLGCAVLFLVSPRAASVSASMLVKSKVEPKEVVLSKDAKDPKAKPVLLTHENHATKNYSEDGKGVIACTVCHHTDQPKTALSGVLKTSERDVVLTSAALKDEKAAPVKTCRECHAQAGAKPAEWPAIPTVKYPDEDDETVLANDEAYHRNCNTCHDAVKKRDAATKAPTTCAGCHNGGTKPS